MALQNVFGETRKLWMGLFGYQKVASFEDRKHIETISTLGVMFVGKVMKVSIFLSERRPPQRKLFESERTRWALCQLRDIKTLSTQFKT